MSVDSDEGAREEVYNVRLSDLLKEYGIMTRPERIKLMKNKRRLPDIIATDILGFRTYIEGRVYRGKQTLTSLEKDSRQRIQESLCTVCVAIVYPHDIRECDDDQINNFLRKTEEIQIRIFTEDKTTEIDEWSYTNLDGLAKILRKTGHDIINESVVKNCKKEIEWALERCEDSFILDPSTSTSLLNVLGISKEKLAI